MQIPKFSNYRFDNKEEVSTNVELLSRNFNNNFDMLSNSLSSLKNIVNNTNKYMEDLPVITGEEQDPNGNYSGKAGTIYRNKKGGAGTTLWVKETEEDTKTGWAPIYGGVPKQYITAYSTTNSVTTAADTWTDVPSMSITLTPGRWRIGYSAAQYLRNKVAGTLSIAGNTAIRTSSGIVLTNTIRGREFYAAANNYYMTTTASAEDIIEVTADTTYIFSHKCGRADTSATSTIYASSFDSTLTDPDNKAVIFAELIESYAPAVNTDSIEKDYGMFSHSGNPDTTYINVGDKLPNNAVIQSNGGIIADTTNRVYQLKANKLYKLSAEVLALFSAAGGHAAFRWYDEETGLYIGSRTYMRPLTFTANNIGITSNSVAFIRTTKNQNVSLRVETKTYLSGTYGSNGGYSWFLIEEIQRF